MMSRNTSERERESGVREEGRGLVRGRERRKAET